MRRIALADETDLDGFRAAARRLAAAGVSPSEVRFEVGTGEADLFAGPDGRDRPGADAETGGAASAELDSVSSPRVPRRFLDLAERVACHSDPGRYDLLYRLLVRFGRTPGLLDIASDPDVHAAQRLAKAVDRDVHKMKAFVRFREVPTPEGSRFAAWFEPQHFIEERAAPFFARRFGPMRWSILTPRRTITWDTERLAFGPGATRSDVPAEDAAEELWLTYFAGIFNPARLKVKAMTAEMPKRYWRNLPEAALIPELIASAETRVRAMIAAEPTEPPLRHRRLTARSGPDMAEPDPTPTPGHNLPPLATLAEEAAGCRRCPLWRDATQVVFGEGPETATVIFVGEQPGDREDLAGRPFVGPAGAVFDEAVAEAGIDRSLVYVTNAVKHFKFEPRGKRRLHKKPSTGEIEACRWWLDREIEVLSPQLLVGMGGTALQSLLGRPVRITELRGRFHATPDGLPVFATVHPSFLLRLPDPELKARERRLFVDDLKRVAERIAALG